MGPESKDKVGCVTMWNKKRSLARIYDLLSPRVPVLSLG